MAQSVVNAAKSATEALQPIPRMDLNAVADIINGLCQQIIGYARNAEKKDSLSLVQ